MKGDEVVVDRVVCVVDCGIAVTPDVVRAQMESAIGYGLGAALHSTITMTDGHVDQTNFHQYQVLRINEMPKIVEVHIVPSKEAPTGVGEPGTPPIAPAVANAIRMAAGIKLRKLPFDLAGSARGEGVTPRALQRSNGNARFEYPAPCEIAFTLPSRRISRSAARHADAASYCNVGSGKAPSWLSYWRHRVWRISVTLTNTVGGNVAAAATSAIHACKRSQAAPPC